MRRSVSKRVVPGSGLGGFGDGRIGVVIMFKFAIDDSVGCQRVTATIQSVT